MLKESIEGRCQDKPKDKGGSHTKHHLYRDNHHKEPPKKERASQKKLSTTHKNCMEYVAAVRTFKSPKVPKKPALIYILKIKKETNGKKK